MDIKELQKKVIDFRNERNWEQYHTLKDLAAGLAIESAELQELFLWKDADEMDELLSSEDGRQKLKEELADVLIFLLYLAEGADVDLGEAVLKKIELNATKYPVEKSYNSNKKYSEL